MTVTRLAPDIAYVIASGVASDIVNLDNLQFANIDPSTSTDADGNYVFTNLATGNYIVREEQQPGWVQTFAPPPVTVGPGANVMNVDFGNHALPGSIHGQTWNDLNGDGVKDPGEPGLQGWKIYLDENHNGQLDQMDDNLEPDDYGPGAC